MTDIFNPDYEICLCRHIKTKDVIAFITENHISSLKELCEKMPIGDKCGGCREDLDGILTIMQEKSQEK